MKLSLRTPLRGAIFTLCALGAALSFAGCSQEHTPITEVDRSALRGDASKIPPEQRAAVEAASQNAKQAGQAASVKSQSHAEEVQKAQQRSSAKTTAP